MGKNLVIVESPAKSKTIEKFLGKDYMVRASMGHLRDLPKSTIGVDIDHGFEPKYINIRGKGDLIKDLKTIAKKADKIYLATDPDREGEAISWHLAYLLGIGADEKCRVEFNEITPAAVKAALKKPHAIDMDKVDAQQARRILDRLVGYKLSPLLWKKISKGLSAGRVQSVAVKIIADRDKEILDFTPEEYWTIKAKLREHAKAPLFEAEVVKYQGKKLELRNAATARAAEAALAQAAYSVAEASRKDRRRHPFPPLNTSSLQQEANKRLNFTSRKTMMLAQQLYEGVAVGRAHVGLITYMRTDSLRLADTARDEIRNYIEKVFGKEYRPERANVFSSKKNAQDAHEAIRPTSVLRTPEEVARWLSRDQLKLYELIWQRAVASQMSDALYEVTTLMIDAGEYQLRASGSQLLFPGFTKLSGKMAEDEKEKPVPYIAPGSGLVLHRLLPAEQHFTEPPAHYTEATLVKELEEKGIGRPSTYAPTIQTILARGYVVKDGKKLLVTDLGIKVVTMLTEYFNNLLNINFSASLENDLDKIAEHQVMKNTILENYYDPFAAAIKEAEEKIGHIELPPETTDIPCEKCGRMMVIKQGRFGPFLACPGFPECRNTVNIPKKTGVPCPLCGGEIIERRTKRGKVFYGCEKYPDCSFTTWDKPIEEKCSQCGTNMAEHYEKSGRKKLYCLNPFCSKARPQPASRGGNTSGK